MVLHTGVIKMRTLLIALGLILLSSAAFGFCLEPSAPYGSPSAPFYYDNICDSWAVDSYRDELEGQLSELNNYAEEAIDYAECKRNKLIGEWNEFVSQNKVYN
jgi:hypothetical protein